jgi:hypothetical protein
VQKHDQLPSFGEGRRPSWRKDRCGSAVASSGKGTCQPNAGCKRQQCPRAGIAADRAREQALRNLQFVEGSLDQYQRGGQLQTME